MQPRISIIIPAFNAGRFIADAVDSVLAQNYCSEELEIIVVDDGSSDNTRDIVSRLSAHHHQIKLLPNERGKGPSGARNTGLVEATGNYVAFLDADDLWYPNHLENGIRFLENHGDVDIVFYNFEIRDYETEVLIGDWFSERNFLKVLKVTPLDDGHFLICDDIFNALLDESFMHLQSMIVRNSSRKGLLLDEAVKRAEDRDFCIKLEVLAKARFAYGKIVTGIYYRHANSLTSNSIHNNLATLLDTIYSLSEYMQSELSTPAIKLKIRKMLLDSHVGIGYCHRQLNNHGLAAKYLLASIHYGISSAQLRELTKIAASFVLRSAFHRTKRLT